MKTRILTGIAASIAIASMALPVLAETPTVRSNKEIDTRVQSLGKLQERIQQLKNISDAQKVSIVTSIQTLLTNLTDLKAKINSEASSTTLKDDMQSITQNYRVYALAIPQLNILAAADRIVTISAMMNEIGTKLQTRLSQASDISNLSTLQSALADFGAKSKDAALQAEAAVNEVSQLKPDQGVKATMAANTTALKDARSKIQAAQKDLVTARKDAQTIIQALAKYDKANKTKKPVTATTTPAATSTTH